MIYFSHTLLQNKNLYLQQTLPTEGAHAMLYESILYICVTFNNRPSIEVLQNVTIFIIIINKNQQHRRHTEKMKS